VGGYQGKILDVNLSSGNIKIKIISQNILREYIGGSGLSAKILYEGTNEKTDPLGPENLLIIHDWSFYGYKIPSSGRHHITAKSPLTGIFGEGDAGGRWGIELKKAGFDGLVIQGKAEKPVYIIINNKDIKNIGC